MSRNYIGITELSKMYSAKLGISEREAEQRIFHFRQLLVEGLCNTSYDGIQFMNFVTLRRVTRAGRKVRKNLATMELVTMPPRVKLTARAGKVLQDAFDGKPLDAKMFESFVYTRGGRA